MYVYLGGPNYGQFQPKTVQLHPLSSRKFQAALSTVETRRVAGVTAEASGFVAAAEFRRVADVVGEALRTADVGPSGSSTGE